MRGLLARLKRTSVAAINNEKAYLAVILGMTCVLTFMQLLVIKNSQEGFGPAIILWLFFYCYLIINVAYVFTATFYITFTRHTPLPDRFLDEVPPTAMIYFIRGESCGLYERMAYTFQCNFLSNVDLWIVSGEAKQKFLDYETDVLRRLQNRFGASRVKYLHSDDPGKRKREMMDLWLSRYSKNYEYFIPCDADSLLPENTALKLLRKGQHPKNHDIAVFQTKIVPANTQTYYSRIQALGAEVLGDKWGKMEQTILGRVLSFGHNCLVRCRPFAELRIPDNVLSHDIWDTAYLDRMGQRTVFCVDITTYEEIPANFVEEARRNARWCFGNLESARLLREKGISLSTKFFVFFGVHRYISELVLLVWAMAGIWISRLTFWGEAVLFNLALELVIMGIIFLHRFTWCRSLKHVQFTFIQVLFSTFVGLNHLFYTSLAVIMFPFKKSQWVPMKKNPYESTDLAFLVRSLWPSTVFGLLCVWISIRYARYWGILSSPMIISFIFGIPFVYFTSKLVNGPETAVTELEI